MFASAALLQHAALCSQAPTEAIERGVGPTLTTIHIRAVSVEAGKK